VRHYRDAWMTMTAVVLVCGVWAAVAELVLATVLTVFFFAAVLGGSVVVMMHDGDHPRTSRPRLVAESLLVGLGGVAVCGTFALLGTAAWLPLLVPVATSPWAVGHVVRVCRRRKPGHPAAHEASARTVLAIAAEPSPVVFPTLDPATLDLEELCWTWRRSYVCLQRCRTVAETSRVVAARQRCLDELERRNPDGLSAWLEAGARAASDPSRYLRPAGPTDVRDNAA
jgi:hypothetical protein